MTPIVRVPGLFAPELPAAAPELEELEEPPAAAGLLLLLLLLLLPHAARPAATTASIAKTSNLLKRCT